MARPRPRPPTNYPLDRALAAADISDAQVPRLRGPSVTTLRAWRRGEGGVRRDAIARLAWVLGLSERSMRVIVEQTIAQAREAREARERGES